MGITLTIGIIFEGDLKSGGGFQQQISTILELNNYSDKKYNFIAFVFSKENKLILEKFGLKTVIIKRTFLGKVLNHFYRQEWFYRYAKKFKIRSKFEKKLDCYKIDLVYFLSPSSLSLDLINHNYIITVWDLCHRDYPEFPEVNYFREFELREQLYTKSLKKAIAVFVDSELGKKNIIKRYNIDENRVFIVPFSPSVNIYTSNYVDIKGKIGINGEYIYYPAQFWSHKNHVYILDAISILKEQGIYVTAVFSGSDKGNLKHVIDYAKKLQVEYLVKYLGFVPNEEIYSLYKNSLALVMPTYFGPTNIPPLEAFAIGVPVIYPDLEGLRDQVGDAALLCDLKKPKSLADHIKSLLFSESLRHELIHKGKKRLEELQRNNLSLVLGNIFEDYYIKLKCWKS